jgi:hypothetical protein
MKPHGKLFIVRERVLLPVAAGYREITQAHSRVNG